MVDPQFYVLVIVSSLLAGSVAGQGVCVAGDSIETSEAASVFDMSGTLFLDTDNPSPCTGSITAFRFCHYESRPLITFQFNSILQLWRPQEEASTFRRVSQFPIEQQIVRRSEDFKCVNVTLSTSEHIPVNEGDVLGAYIPGFLGLRMVSEGIAGSQLYFIEPGPDIDQLTEVTVSDNQLLTSHKLHLTAEIVIADSPTNSPDSTTNNPDTTQETTTVATLITDLNNSTTEFTFTSTTTTPPNITNTSAENQQGPGGISDGGVAAIIIVLLIIIGAAIAVVLIVVFFWYKKKRVSSWEKNMKRRRNREESSFDNAMYEGDAVRANSALANYLNSTNMTDYEIPISTKSTAAAAGSGAPLSSRNPMESMYVAMDGVESVQIEQKLKNSNSVDSFETYPDSQDGNERYEVPKRNRRTLRQNTEAVFDIYRSFGPESELYCQFMEETVSQTGSLPHGINGILDPYADPPSNEEEIYKSLSTKTKNIDQNDIQIMGEIGSGEFAFVNKALWMEKTGVSLTVALKTLHSSATHEERLKLLQEAAIMGQFVHPNVVRLIGVVRSGDEVSMVTEYCARGDLINVLTEMKPEKGELPSNTPSNLLSYSQQVALAMHYLSSKGFVHRDLAARNIFVTQENICKLGDFGMSRDLANAEFYESQGGAIPVRWTAPEAIFFCKYSTASDVWSYGCLLFEIWSMGKKPFGGLPNTEVLETVKTGYRLPPPPGCPQIIYKIMIQCWHPETESRPAFRDVLESMLKEDKELLEIPNEDASSSPQATQLGAPLEAGKLMYFSLQHTYLSKPPMNKRETIYEAIENFSISGSLPKSPLTPRASHSNAAPPLPSRPIPKAPLSKKSSILSIGSNFSSGTPINSKPPLQPKPSNASLSGLSASHPTSPAIPPKPRLTGTPSGGSIADDAPSEDAIYDDIEGTMLGAPYPSTDHGQQDIDDIYEDIAAPDQIQNIPPTSIYEIPSDARESYDPYDMDYEDI